MSKTKPHKPHKKSGLAPGSIIYTGNKSDKDLFIELFEYNKNECVNTELTSVEEAFKYKLSESVVWININGLNHVKDIEKLGVHYNLHPLVIEDLVSISQRPKLDEYNDSLFLVLKMLYLDENESINYEQISFILGENYVLSFQESEGDVFNPIRERLKSNLGQVRQLPADYLLYALIDTIVDEYFSIVENLSISIEDLENSIFDGRTIENANQKIQILKKEVLKVRRTIVPLREVISRIEKNDSALLNPNTKTHFRDIYDHLIQITETIEINREMVWGLMDMYMTTISYKMNEIMKVLTIMTSIFIPLTFIAGIYGMNFENMPELQLKNGYFIILGVMFVIFMVLLYYFKRKKWL